MSYSIFNRGHEKAIGLACGKGLNDSFNSAVLLNFQDLSKNVMSFKNTKHYECMMGDFRTSFTKVTFKFKAS